jgi:hypothetical protein
MGNFEDIGGSDFDTPTARIKPTDLNDNNDLLASWVKVAGSIFNDTAQNLFNADYIGFDSRLNVTGAPNLKNVVYSTFKTDDADVNYGFVYDAANDYYYTPDFDETEYVIIEADDDSISWTSNDTRLVKIASGKWLLYGTSGTDAVKRAQIHKSLWYGTDGTNQLVLDFNNITAIKTSHANDVGKRAFYAKFTSSSPSVDGTNSAGSYDLTFNNTSTNSNCSTWSRCNATNSANATADGVGCRWEIASGTTRNSITTSTTPANSTSDEMGTDTSGDEINNPANAQLENYTLTSNDNYSRGADNRAIILCVGDITFTENATPTGDGSVSFNNTDFYTDHSIPLLTAVGTTSAEGLDTSTLIFKDTASSSVTNCIPVINSTIDASSSVQISVSADGGSNWTDVNNAEIARPTAGTELWRRIVITRTDLSVEDKVTEQAIKYNLY